MKIIERARRTLSKSGTWRVFNVTFVIWITLFGASVFLLLIGSYRNNIEDMIPRMEEIEVPNSMEGYLIKTKGCKIPDLPISTKTLESYFIDSFEDAHCNKGKPPLVESNITSLFVVKSSLISYNITNQSLLLCCYEELKRKIPRGESDHLYEFSKERICFDMEDQISVTEEFLHVTCEYNDKRIYEDLFAFVPKKQNITRIFDSGKINVLVIGIDGVSRINFHRQMPKTVGYLKKLDFLEFLGYNKIADNTYPNLVAVLTGNDENTIEKTCKKSTKYYDNCPFIWNSFKKNHYVTSYAEDSAWMGTFNYQKHGFQKQPTDYMWGFFDRVGENLIGNEKSMNVIQCIGPREGYKMIVQYIRDFVHQMKSWRSPYFAFFWSSSLSHDDVNKPRIGDDVYLRLFKHMYAKGYFENTVVIVMSDHGIRWGSFRQTYQGRIEERLPFLFIRLPKEFKKKYSVATSNLRVNLRRLTTPFDLHETLYDLSVPDNLSDEFIAKGDRKSNSINGLSLFHKIQPTRTCGNAGIVDHWCTCLDSTPLDITSEVLNSSRFAVHYLNDLLKGYAQCATLQLKKVNNAQRLSHTAESVGSKAAVNDLLISFDTVPGDGSFEATIRKSVQGNMSVVGTISRLNLYGKQSTCITDFHLKLYCYCKKGFW